MPTEPDAERAALHDELASELERMIDQQRQRCLDLARRLRPGLTADDITQPHDFPELAESWHWNYEDGVLAGLLSAQLTLRRVAGK
jgi:hypothetical protein